MLALPAAILVGLAFAAPVMAFTAHTDSEANFAYLFRFGVMPLFLFSGTFFPITQLPQWLEVDRLGHALWHGVALCRDLVARARCSGSTSSTSATSAPCSWSASGWPTSRSAVGWWSEMTTTPTTMPPTPPRRHCG